MGQKCGEWIEVGFFGGQKTVTYDPCPPDLEDASGFYPFFTDG